MDLIATIAFVRTGSGHLTPFDYEELTISNVALGLTAAKVAAAFACEVYFEAGPMRYTIHTGGAPTTTVGLPAFDGYREVFAGPAMENFKAIRSGTTDGALRVVYYKAP